MKYLLIFLSLAPAWGGSITLFGGATSSCVVTTLPTNAIVANDCDSTPGISASGSGQLSINVQWGKNMFQVITSLTSSATASNEATDPNLIVTESLAGHLEYDQNFIITGGSGVGFISYGQFKEDDQGASPASCSSIISTGVNPTDPNGLLPFTFGVPFSLQALVDVNINLTDPFRFERGDGEGCDAGITGINVYDAQGQQLTNFDVEPDVPEPGTWLLVSLGLLGCGLMKLRAS